MKIHHTKHHQAYTDGLNETLIRINALSHKNYIIGILSDLNSVTEIARDAINFHGGGYENHRMFWESMKPTGGGKPVVRLADEIEDYFGSFIEFKEDCSHMTIA